MPAEAVEPPVGIDEGFLGEVVGEGCVAAGEMAKKAADGGLMSADEFPESGAVIAREYARDEVGIRGSHRGGGTGAVYSRREARASMAEQRSRAMPMNPGMQPR